MSTGLPETPKLTMPETEGQFHDLSGSLPPDHHNLAYHITGAGIQRTVLSPGEGAPVMNYAPVAQTPALEVVATRPEKPAPNHELGIMAGEPWMYDNSGGGIFYVPEVPHVFNARLALREHDNSPQIEMPNEPKILIAHGEHSPDGTWVFRKGIDGGPGEPVATVVARYNEHNPDAPIRNVVVCNEAGETMEPDMKDVTHAIGTKIKVRGYREAGQTHVEIVSLDPSPAKNHVPTLVTQQFREDFRAQQSRQKAA